MFPFFNSFSTLLLFGLCFYAPTDVAFSTLQSTDPPSAQPNQHRSLRIASGSLAARSRFPYVATIAFEDNSNRGFGLCGGTMIDEQWILTAASCIGRAQSRLYISFGDSEINPQQLINRQEADLVAAHFVYPLYYNNLANGSDIGLLFLNAPQNDVAFPRLPSNEVSYEVEESLVGVGRGQTGASQDFSHVLQVANDLVPNDMGTCQNQTNSAPTNMNEPVLICVAGPESESSQGICQGDAGNALVLVNSNTTSQEESDSEIPGNPADDIIYGIASFGLKECGEPDQFSLYTNVYQYVEWITTTINNFTPFENNSLPPDQVYDEDDGDDGESSTVWLILGIVLGSCLVFAVILTTVLCRWTRVCSFGSKPNHNETVISQETTSRPGESLLKQHSIIQISPFLASLGLSSQTESTSEGPVFVENLNLDISVHMTGKRIGKGAFGQVEEGLYINNEGVQVPVAVKSINLETSDAKSSLFNEMRIFERVGHHPNIVYCYGGNLHHSSNDSTGYYLVQELMVCDLGRFLADQDQRQKFTFQQYLQIFRGIANGLEHLHKCDVIHFDLKPSNILLDANSTPKLADFGCSRKRAHTYITAGARGTMAYMAPELWLLGLCVRKAQVRAEKLDVFSFGVVMWETFTNQTPLDPLNIQEFLITQNSQDPEASTFQDRSEIEIDQDFRNRRFPLSDRNCPVELKELMWSCLSYLNEIRPTLVEIKSRIEQMFEANWTDQKIKDYRIT